MNNYRIISDIGSGAYSTVHKAIDVNTGHIVAIKKISEQNMNIKHIINREVAFLNTGHNHPNIIQLFNCFTMGTFIYLVFQYMPMDLISFYKSVQESRKRNLNEEEISYISFQVCNALKFLHQKGIMHRDVKPQNILIDPQNLNVKLIDFGFAKYNSSLINTNYMVTRWYRPLEVVLSLPYNQKVDVFAAGALILELYLGKQIFRSSSNIDQFYWVVNICGNPHQSWTAAFDAMTKFNIKFEQVIPQLKELLKTIKPLASDLITKMLKTSPDERISMIDAFQHPYFSRFKLKSLTLSNNYESKLQSVDSKSRYEIVRNFTLKQNRAFSAEQNPHLLNNLTHRQNNKKKIQKTQISEDNAENRLDTIRSRQIKKNYGIKLGSGSSQAACTLNPKKHYIKRVSGEKNNENLKSVEYLNSKNIKIKNQQKTDHPKNRIKSLNPHGINVISLKKLKIQRQIQNQKCKQKSFQKIKDQTKDYFQTARPYLKNQKDKPMFLRVKQKINEGKINQRGEQKSQLVTSLSGRKTSNPQISTQIISSASLKVRKTAQYKQYQLDD